MSSLIVLNPLLLVIALLFGGLSCRSDQTDKLRDIIAKQEEDYRSYVTLSARVDTLESKSFPNVDLESLYGKPITTLDLFKNFQSCIVILEPRDACGSCLEVALESWHEYRNSLGAELRSSLIIITANDPRRVAFYSRKDTIQMNCVYDKNSVLKDYLFLPQHNTTILFLMNIGNSFRIVYAEIVDWKKPERTNSFFSKVRNITNRNSGQ